MNPHKKMSNRARTTNLSGQVNGISSSNTLTWKCFIHRCTCIIVVMWGSAISLKCWSLRDLVSRKILNHVQVHLWLVISWKKQGPTTQCHQPTPHMHFQCVPFMLQQKKRVLRFPYFTLFLLILLYMRKAAKSTCCCTVSSLLVKHSHCITSQTKLYYTSTWYRWPCTLGLKLQEFVIYQ